ncbi:alpha-L-rhamnosidase C-terminal domain-containing protein [Mucilaginibacter sp. UR6-11]|uniref:alpha-L-rhamnosidase C-terminal domain-containing protein n=1 Tax=Mucilaginibacter sp. UR6-11 TaxID=1435644 RepID=UPI001E625858|nr:alpha-L-rhamnosidase C-terminal domain-containing protein [Mucilaginibacter sp. UR6-11]MCC8425828.1 hypothetical protein [Mucilaginibacter sp. UR6-11]
MLNIYNKLIAVLFIAAMLSPSLTKAQGINYQAITAKRSGATNPLSPDPLVNYSWPNPKATDDLQTYSLHSVSFKTNDAGFDMSKFKEDNLITVKGKGDIRFDFGRTNAGWLEFESDDLTDSIALSISEYNEPAIVNEGALHRFKTLAPVKHGNTYRLELNPELYEGVRFGWVHVLSHKKNWHIKNLRLICQIKPTNYKGSFACSDPELTRIWYTGAYTVKLNLLKSYFGAILMERSDRQSWTGDAYPSQAASMVAFGNYDFVKANLINTSGLDNGIASYSLYWVLSLIDYVNYSGDTEFGEKYIENACEKLDKAYQNYGKSPRLGFYGWDERLGAGFENPDNPETENAYSMLSIRSWAEFGRLMKQIGRADLAEKYTGYAQAKINEERNQNSWLTTFGLHASADAVNTGLTNFHEDSVFYQLNYTDRVNRVSYSPFNEYFIIGALAKMQRYDDALSSVKDVWGGQLRYGGTTFFEVYRPSWNQILANNDAPVNNQCGYTSLTHPWSAGVVKWLSEEVLGIKPLEPGFSVFRILPHLGSRLTSVKGVTPTVHGLICVDFNLRSGINRFTIPTGAIAKSVAIPLAGTISSVSLNGRLILHTGMSRKNIEIKDRYLNLYEVTPGKYECRIIYKSVNNQTLTKEVAWKYAINKITQDSLTGGQWIKRYGKDGYMLFNYFNSGKHLQKLPTCISAIGLRHEANVLHTIATPGNYLLTDTAGFAHHLGAITTRDPKACLQTMTLDIKVTDSNVHQIALYLLDWDSKDRRSAIEVFDLKTLNLLAPVQLVKNYQKGKYMVFNYSGSIRIRINQITGKNAALSGVFFDPVL